MSKLAWGSVAVGVIATLLVLWFMNSRKKASV